MTAREALNKLDETLIGNLEFKVVLSKALEKQIPKKPVVHGFDPNKLINSVHYTCPTCNSHISITNYCEDCGQALDWSVSND